MPGVTIEPPAGRRTLLAPACLAGQHGGLLLVTCCSLAILSDKSSVLWEVCILFLNILQYIRVVILFSLPGCSTYVYIQTECRSMGQLVH
jgi:hypothetical protein